MFVLDNVTRCFAAIVSERQRSVLLKKDSTPKGTVAK